ncbi:MAG: hypothetical protein JO060_00775 [Candidatus Eremiobacteraeota bacterium]|nr:hypothetical protein [Candidatus Eremiobacteraeota bacterium]MBV9646272.1 hypothetical protein [Candidatus Eremiobacteraeota bacterium]
MSDFPTRLHKKAHLLVLVLAALTGCASSVEVPSNVTVGQRRATLAPGPNVDFASPPRISAVWLSSLTLRRGEAWAGEISTSSNTASVEVRTDSFSFSVPRVRIGEFAFSYAIPDLPPYLRRPFLLHVVARNAGGDRLEETLPIEIK